MIIEIIQASKELFSGEFTVNNESNNIGGFSFSGSISSMEADVQCNIENEHYQMSYNRKLKSKEKFRPYSIYKYDSEIGNVFMTENKVSFFKGYSFKQLEYGGAIYEMYAIGMGKEGLKLPIYCNGNQIAQIDEGNIIKDMRHNYKAYIENEYYLNIVVLFCAYLYVTGPYVPGEKAIHSTEKIFSTTTNKLLKEKYNPNFVNQIKK